MCAGAILQARIPVVCFGARDPKGGAMGGVLDLFWEDFNHRPAVTAGILEPECAALLEAFSPSCGKSGRMAAASDSPATQKAKTGQNSGL